ncbi:MAG TPA: hypothetical protein VFX37_15255 [Pseudolabrys sp.]|nr:hypothetical protein [Pseudolabrys sp.]
MSDLTWAANRRLDFIDWAIAVKSELQRSDIIDLFGVSMGQASADINEFISRYPDAITYDKSAKRYVPARANYRRRRKGAWVQAIDWACAAGRNAG